MALSEVQILECYDVLGITRGSRASNPYALISLDIENILAGLSEDQETLITQLLSQWDKVKFSVGTLKGEYNESSSDKRSRVKARLINIIGYDPDLSSSFQSPFRIGRA